MGGAQDRFRGSERLAELEKIGSEEFVTLLKRHELFREDDVTFDDIDDGAKYRYVGDDFIIDKDALEKLDVEGLLIVGNLEIDFLDVNDVLSDYGVLCVTGDVTCENFVYMTESTGVSIGGNLVVKKAFFADCGNSVLQVNGDFVAELLCNSQCSVDVGGEERYEEKTTEELAQALGLDVEDYADDAIQSYFEEIAES